MAEEVREQDAPASGGHPQGQGLQVAAPAADPMQQGQGGTLRIGAALQQHHVAFGRAQTPGLEARALQGPQAGGIEESAGQGGGGHRRSVAEAARDDRVDAMRPRGSPWTMIQIQGGERGAMSCKVLVVDDEPDVPDLVSQWFRAEVREGTYRLAFAASGAEALVALADKEPVDILLSDIRMPGMSGLELLDRTREVDPVCRTVMMTAYRDMENIRTAMNRGAFDFLVKPVNVVDLKATI